jgi:hypothetical protein
MPAVTMHMAVPDGNVAYQRRVESILICRAMIGCEIGFVVRVNLSVALGSNKTGQTIMLVIIDPETLGTMDVFV